jgi:hypothetical protein
MKVFSNGASAFSSCANGSNRSRAIRSILFRTNQRGTLVWAGSARIVRISSFAPAFTSTSISARSAFRAPVQAAATIARSSLRRGLKIPGVSTRSTWLSPLIMIPRIRNRVVCGFGVTIDSFAPVS